MSIKKTTIYYPHIVKEYESVNQLIEENGYTEFYDVLLAELVTGGIDINDETQYQVSLSDDLFEAVATVVFSSEEAYAKHDEEPPEWGPSVKGPIFIEKSEDHLF